MGDLIDTSNSFGLRCSAYPTVGHCFKQGEIMDERIMNVLAECQEFNRSKAVELLQLGATPATVRPLLDSLQTLDCAYLELSHLHLQDRRDQALENPHVPMSNPRGLIVPSHGSPYGLSG
jgi:hypothetical protein